MVILSKLEKNSESISTTKTTPTSKNNPATNNKNDPYNHLHCNSFLVHGGVGTPLDIRHSNITSKKNAIMIVISIGQEIQPLLNSLFSIN